MRKLVLILLVLAVLPAAIFAEGGLQFGIGGAAFYKSPYLLGQKVDTANLNANQFSFGGDLRLKLAWFQAEALVLYSAGDVNSLNTYLDAGVALDVAILRISLGAGPNFSYSFGSNAAAQAGLNAKIGADLVFGPIQFGLSYIMTLNLASGVNVATRSGLLGAQVIFWL
jgi:hypothetical protein